MNKYKNISNTKIILNYKADFVFVNPGEIVELDFVPTEYEKVLVQDTIKSKIDISDIEEHQSSDLPEDFVVLIDDAVVEDIRKEQTKQLAKKPQGRKAK